MGEVDRCEELVLLVLLVDPVLSLRRILLARRVLPVLPVLLHDWYYEFYEYY